MTITTYTLSNDGTQMDLDGMDTIQHEDFCREVQRQIDDGLPLSAGADKLREFLRS